VKFSIACNTVSNPTILSLSCYEHQLMRTLEEYNLYAVEKASLLLRDRGARGALRRLALRTRVSSFIASQVVLLIFIPLVSPPPPRCSTLRLEGILIYGHP
jgi:hypothetical protein